MEEDLEVWLGRHQLQHLLQDFEAQKLTLDLILQHCEEIIEQLPSIKIGDKLRLRSAVKSCSDPQGSDRTDLSSTPSTNTEPEDPAAKKTRENSPAPGASSGGKTNPPTDGCGNSDLVYVVQSGQHTSTSYSSLGSGSTVTLLNNSFTHGIANDVRLILNENFLGRAILTKYEKTGGNTLTEHDRNTICDIIVNYYLNKGIKLNNVLLSDLADQITIIFPTEKKGIYYVDPIPKAKSPRHRPEVATGKLVNKNRNILAAVNKTLPRETTNGNRGSNNEESDDQDLLVSARDSKTWLKFNTEPKVELLEHWEKSYPIRTLKTTIDDFFLEWPILQTDLAPELINWDYSKKFGVVAADVHELFGTFFGRVLEKRSRLLSASDTTLLQFLDEDLTNDSKNTIKLFLLPSLVPPKGRRRIRRKEDWKPSVSEARDGLFLHVKSPSDIDSARKSKVNFMYSKGMTVQPYMIIVGPSLNNITASYVVINENIFRTKTVLEALDFCYKSYHVLDASYSFECQHLWYLVQNTMYGLTTKTDLCVSYVQDI